MSGVGTFKTVKHQLTLRGGVVLSLMGGLQGPPGPAVPAGSAGQVIFSDGGQAGFDAGFTYNKTTGVLTLSGKTQTANAPALQVSQTWNNAAVAFTGALVNVTNTASAAGSKILDLQVGGASKWSVDRGGNVAAVGSVSAPTGSFGTSVAGGSSSLTTTGLYSGAADASHALLRWAGSGVDVVSGDQTQWSAVRAGSIQLINGGITATGGLSVQNGAFLVGNGVALKGFWFGFDNGSGGYDAQLYRDGAGIWAFRSGTQAQKLAVYSSYTDPANNSRIEITGGGANLSLLSKGIGTGATTVLTIGSGDVGGSLLFQTNGATNLWLDTSGNLRPYASANSFDVGAASYPFRNGYFGTALYTPIIAGAASGSLTLQAGGSNYFTLSTSGHLLPTNGNNQDLAQTAAPMRTGYFGTNVQSPQFTAAAAGPLIRLNATGQTANNKLWDFFVSGGNLIFRTIDDTLSTAANWMTVSRSGTALAGITINAGPLSVIGSGATSFYGGYTDASNNYGVSIGWLGGGLQFSTFFSGTGNGGSQPPAQINGQSVILGIGTTGKVTLDTGGHWRPYGTDNASDNGGSSTRWRTGYFGTSLFVGSAPPNNSAKVVVGLAVTDSATAPTAVSKANAYVGLGGAEYSPNAGVHAVHLIGFGYSNNAATQYPAYMGYWETTTGGNTYGDLIFLTRNVQTDTAPSIRFRVTSDGHLLAEPTSGGAIRAGSFTVATLPSAASVGDGARAMVTDATQTYAAANIGAAPTAGGTNKVPVIAFGGAWVIG